MSHVGARAADGVTAGVGVPPWRSAAVCLAVAAACLTAGPVDAQTTAAAGRQLVVPFENTTRAARVYWLSEGAAVLLTDNLITAGEAMISRDDRMVAFERLRVPPIATLSHATVIRIGQVVGANRVVLGSFDLRDERLTVRARVLRLDTGRFLPEIVEQGPLNELFSIFGRVAVRIAPSSSATAAQLAQAHPPLPAFEQYIKGVLAGTPATQVNFLTQALKLAPTFQRPRLALWDVYTDEGEHRRALDIVRQIPPEHPQARRGRFLGALSMINLAQYQQATDVLLDLNRARVDAAVLTALGIAQLRRSGAQALKPVTFFADATKADPNDPDLFFNLGYASWLDRDIQGAIAALREAVRRNPADDAAHYVLGVALQASGSLAEASREKELARQLSSTYAEWEARQPGGNTVPRGLERMKTRLDADREVRVEDVIVAAGQRDQRELAAFHLDAGRRLVLAEKDVEAIAELRRAVYLAPYNSEANFLLGRAYLRSGRTADAIDALKIAIWADANNRAARELLATIPAQ